MAQASLRSWTLLHCSEGVCLLWILEILSGLRNSGRELLKLVSPFTGNLRTSKPSRAWRWPIGWQCLPSPPHSPPASAQTRRAGTTQLLKTGVPVMWRLNSFDTGKIVLRSRIPVPSTQPQAGCHSDGEKKAVRTRTPTPARHRHTHTLQKRFFSSFAFSS